MTRISQTFTKLKSQNKKAFTAFITAGDPDFDTSFEILKSLPKNGVDIIELGIPFLDPAGDGPTIEEASKRAIRAGMKLKKVLQMVEQFRKINDETPIILMGYYNPILHYGIKEFCVDAKKFGVDGLLIVDLPPEEDLELKIAAQKNNLDFIRLIALTSDENRIKEIAKSASGFLYLVSILGITGTKSAVLSDIENHLEKIKKVSDLPVMVGFGIKEKKQVEEMYKTKADGIVVGSALVKIIEDVLKNNGDKKSIPDLVGEKIKGIRG